MSTLKSGPAFKIKCSVPYGPPATLKKMIDMTCRQSRISRIFAWYVDSVKRAQRELRVREALRENQRMSKRR